MMRFPSTRGHADAGRQPRRPFAVAAFIMLNAVPFASVAFVIGTVPEVFPQATLDRIATAALGFGLVLPIGLHWKLRARNGVLPLLGQLDVAVGGALVWRSAALWNTSAGKVAVLSGFLTSFVGLVVLLRSLRSAQRAGATR